MRSLETEFFHSKLAHYKMPPILPLAFDSLVVNSYRQLHSQNDQECYIVLAPFWVIGLEDQCSIALVWEEVTERTSLIIFNLDHVSIANALRREILRNPPNPEAHIPYSNLSELCRATGRIRHMVGKKEYFVAVDPYTGGFANSVHELDQKGENPRLKLPVATKTNESVFREMVNGIGNIAASGFGLQIDSDQYRVSSDYAYFIVPTTDGSLAVVKS